MRQVREAPSAGQAANRRHLQPKKIPRSRDVSAVARSSLCIVEPLFFKALSSSPNVSWCVIFENIDQYSQTVAEQQRSGHKPLKTNLDWIENRSTLVDFLRCKMTRLMRWTAPAGAARGFDRWQAQGWADLETGRPLFAAHSGGGARAVLKLARQKPEKYPWLTQRLARQPFKVAAVALANKMARVAWALLAKGGTYYRAPALVTEVAAAAQ